MMLPSHGGLICIRKTNLEILLILFVIAVALAPLTHFLPSKRQRQVAKLREYAAVHGLFVEFRNLPGSDISITGSAQRAQQMIYYGKRLPPSRREPRSRLAWLPGERGWKGQGHRQPAPACSEKFPAHILASSQEEGSCGVYWLEPGTEQDVQCIVDALEAWAEELIGASGT